MPLSRPPLRGNLLSDLANPGLEGSGLTNESKADLFNLLGPVGRAHFTPFVTVRTGPPCATRPVAPWSAARLAFPVVVKPDIGRRGFGVKTVHSEQQLAEHSGKYPSRRAPLIQRYAEGPCEAGCSICACRRRRIRTDPVAHHQALSGGRRRRYDTLRELILRDTGPAISPGRISSAIAGISTRDPAGRALQLVSVGNHVRGAAFEDGSSHITPAMEQVFDTIVGRGAGLLRRSFDVRYAAVDALKRGEELMIVEYNGAGGEPTAYLGPRTSVIEDLRGAARALAVP